MSDNYDEESAEAYRARDFFSLACDAEGVPKRMRVSTRPEHWSSVVRQAAGQVLPAYEDVRHLVWMFGRVGPEGRATAEAAARLGGWKASVDFVVAECARLGDGDLAAIGKGRAA